MKIENVRAHPHNIIPLTDKQWEFQTFEDRPAMVTVKDGSAVLFIGAKGNKSLYDGEFYKSHEFKTELPVVWDRVAEHLAKVEIKIID